MNTWLPWNARSEFAKPSMFACAGFGGAFGSGGAGHVRISFAADDGRLREGLARLTAFVNGLRNPGAVKAEPPAEEPAAAASCHWRSLPATARVTAGAPTPISPIFS